MFEERNVICHKIFRGAQFDPAMEYLPQFYTLISQRFLRSKVLCHRGEDGTTLHIIEE